MFWYKIKIFFVVTFSYEGVVCTRCDARSQENLRILGGQEVDIQNFPYAISYGTQCAGAVLSYLWVITAAHCRYQRYIRAGSSYATQGEQFRILQHVYHPLWKTPNKEHAFDYDFLLLKLENALVYTNTIKPLSVGYEADVFVGKIVAVMGWGQIKHDGSFATKLRMVTMPIVSMEICQEIPYNNYRGTLTPRMFCAGYEKTSIDSCQGDSGGPAVANGRLLGLVSFGYGCGIPGVHGVYSKVGAVRTWISQTIR